MPAKTTVLSIKLGDYARRDKCMAFIATGIYCDRTKISGVPLVIWGMESIAVMDTILKRLSEHPEETGGLFIQGHCKETLLACMLNTTAGIPIPVEDLVHWANHQNGTMPESVTVQQVQDQANRIRILLQTCPQIRTAANILIDQHHLEMGTISGDAKAYTELFCLCMMLSLEGIVLMISLFNLHQTTKHQCRLRRRLPW